MVGGHDRSQYKDTFGGDAVQNMSKEEKEMSRKRSQEIKKVLHTRQAVVRDGLLLVIMGIVSLSACVCHSISGSSFLPLCLGL